MRRRLLALVAAVSVVVGIAAPVEAVRNGQPDNGAHPFVGLVVFYDAGGTPTHRCSGTMINSTVLLTAGHCTFGAASAQVWFNEHVTTDTGYPLSGGFTGAPHTYTYNGSLTLPDTGDLGVVVLNAAPGVGNASIAGIGSLDSLATQRGQQNVNFDVVGYGLQEVRPQEMAERSRLKASVTPHQPAQRPDRRFQHSPHQRSRHRRRHLLRRLRWPRVQPRHQHDRRRHLVRVQPELCRRRCRLPS